MNYNEVYQDSSGKLIPSKHVVDKRNGKLKEKRYGREMQFKFSDLAKGKKERPAIKSRHKLDLGKGKAKSKALDFFKKGMGGKGNNLPPGRKDSDNE